MKKVAIITLNGYYNYGNRLQNYATQEVLSSLGFLADTLVNRINMSKGYQKVSIFKKLNAITINKLYKKANQKIWTYRYKDLINDRTQVFKDFTKKYISEDFNDFLDKDVIKDINNKYNYFITGSDQVWNPLYNKKSSINFLTFAPKNKRIAYSPSFGVSHISEEFSQKYRDWLSEINFLSVREQAGADIIKELTGRDAPVLVDPTLMLTKEKWISIAQEASNKPKKDYLLTYFLGEISKENKKMINDIAMKNNLQIINLADIKDRQTYTTGPSEFIDYINSASVLCTDSFHGCVFSILMETPFIVFDRVGSQSMYSRIETLLSKFKLESRKAPNIKTNEQVFNVDFSHVPPILERERKKSLDYLKKALNLEEVEDEN